MNSVSVKANGKGISNLRAGKPGTIRCFSCGNRGHKENDKRCPARGGHSEVVCKTELKTSDGIKKSGMDRRVRKAEVEYDDNDDCV